MPGMPGVPVPPVETTRLMLRGAVAADLDDWCARIFAVVVPENTASWKVLERIEFVCERQARYYDLDVVYYAIGPEQFRWDGSFSRVHPRQPVQCSTPEVPMASGGCKPRPDLLRREKVPQARELRPRLRPYGPI